ncbi:Hypothetical protein, putative [Bodo saltans]|uniref:Uncharacterized protein n=1 Tax=Bodo saltans TaxID=75058 RepID=A0A0S4J1M8_BODSA|nr:Hypothetical protein, putative [Bodo saltans]|eukprot:CUG81262.1 Hypothetical protein, putative [Bodo saltans]
MPPQVTHSSKAHRKRQHHMQTLKPFQQSMSSLTETSQSLPHHFIINIWAWNGSSPEGQPVRVGLHPAVGLRCWQAAVSTIFEACHAGVGDKTVFTAHGVALQSYESFLIHFSEEKQRHDKRYSNLFQEHGGSDRVWQGPRAPVAHRVTDPTVERVFYVDVVCCPRGAPFSCPRQLEENVTKRQQIDDRHATIEASLSERALHSPTNARRVVPAPITNNQFGDQRVVLFNSAASQSKRRDNPLVHRAAVVEDDVVSEDGDASLRAQGTFDDPNLMGASTRLRRLSSATALLTQGPQILERALSMRKQMLQSLYKDDVPEDSLDDGAVLQLQSSMRRQSFRVGRDASPTSSTPQPQQSQASSPTRLTRFAPLSKGGRAQRVGDGSPKRQSKSELVFLQGDALSVSDNVSRSLVSPSTPERRSRHPAPSGPKSFPLGVVRNRLQENVKLDGGAVHVGMLVTSSETGEMYKVEAIDPSTNTAHCRWVLRAPDPLLSHFVDCTENSLVHKLHLGEHYTKYEFHWLRRLQVAKHLAALQHQPIDEGGTTSRSQTARGVKGTPPMDTTPFEEHLDDTMMCYGCVPIDSLDPFSKHRHHASPMMQRRIQRNGGFCDDDESDDEDSAHGEESPSALYAASIALLSPGDVAILKDFEALFPSGNKKGRHEHIMLQQQVREQLPSLVTSRQVSFLTDMCAEIKLSHLRPTTTFRFLMWIDLGFVLALRLMMEQYQLLAPNAVQGGGIPDVDVTFRQPHGDVMDLFLRSTNQPKKAPLGNIPFRVFAEGAGKSAPVEGCGGHEHEGNRHECLVCGFHFGSKTSMNSTQELEEPITMIL